MNTQKPLKFVKEASPTLSVHSVFRTIQGEGPFSGRPAIFVRLAGCNLQCPQCDTSYEEVYKASVDKLVSDIILKATTSGIRPIDLVVITGGEPFRQDITALVPALNECGFVVQIETNGNFYRQLPTSKNVVIVCSPKTSKVHELLQNHELYFKYVLDKDSWDTVDGLPCKVLGNPTVGDKVCRPPHNIARNRIYLQPADTADVTNNAVNMAIVTSNCIRFGYTLCLQTHKIAGLE